MTELLITYKNMKRSININ